MRKLLLLIAIMICSISFAQIKEYNILSIIQSPGSYDDGFSIGIQFEHRDNILYYGAEAYYFPALHDIDYLHGIGRIGLQTNIIQNIFNEPILTVHSGIRAGFIYRYNEPHGIAGLESGIDLFLGQLVIGIAWTKDTKADSKVYSNDSYHEVNSGIIRIGYTF